MVEQQAMVPQNIVTETTQVESRGAQKEPNTIVMVSAHKQYVANLIKDLHTKVIDFKAGRISQCIDERRKITSDPDILDLVTGYALN